MSKGAVYQAVFPIGDSNPLNLPVRDLEAEVDFYENVLGFQIASRSQNAGVKSARLTRDGITLGLAENGGDPEQASCYIAVSDVEAARSEAVKKGAEPTEIRADEHGGDSYRVFFVRDPDGVCYCLGQKA